MYILLKMCDNFGWLSRGLPKRGNDLHVSYQELSYDNWVCKLTLLVDFCVHLNDLNVN